MGVRVREKRQGSGVWCVFVNHQGRRKAKRIGRGRAGKNAAEQVARKLAAKLALGDVGYLDQERRVPTLKEYAERWLRETIAPHRKERTEDYYRQIIENHLAPALGALERSRRSRPAGSGA
jgi:integrase